MSGVFINALYVMLWGMIGIFGVLTIIYIGIKIMMKLFPGDDKQ